MEKTWQDMGKRTQQKFKIKWETQVDPNKQTHDPYQTLTIRTVRPMSTTLGVSHLSAASSSELPCVHWVRLASLANKCGSCMSLVLSSSSSLRLFLGCLLLWYLLSLIWQLWSSLKSTEPLSLVVMWCLFLSYTLPVQLSHPFVSPSSIYYTPTERKPLMILWWTCSWFSRLPGLYCNSSGNPENWVIINRLMDTQKRFLFVFFFINWGPNLNCHTFYIQEVALKFRNLY